MLFKIIHQDHDMKISGLGSEGISLLVVVISSGVTGPSVLDFQQHQPDGYGPELMIREKTIYEDTVYF